MDPTAKTEGRRLLIREWHSVDFAVNVRPIRMSGARSLPGGPRWIRAWWRTTPMSPWQPIVFAVNPTPFRKESTNETNHVFGDARDARAPGRKSQPSAPARHDPQRRYDWFRLHPFHYHYPKR